MATAYRVFGPCLPQLSTGTNSAFEVLGVCQNGGTVELITKERPIFSDLGGPEEPVEIQQMGQRAVITFELAAVDESVLTKAVKRSVGNSAGAEGTPADPGKLMGTNSESFKLYLPSSNVNPWVFTNCRIVNESVKEATEHSPPRLRFEAWRYVAGSAANVTNTTLYTRAAP